jgi:hypothetical protein
MTYRVGLLSVDSMTTWRPAADGRDMADFEKKLNSRIRRAISWVYREAKSGTWVLSRFMDYLPSFVC